MVRRLAGSSVIDRGPFTVVRTPHNRWFHWGNFLLWPGPPAPGELGEWITRFSEEFPGAAHVTLGIDGTESPERPDPHGDASSVGLEVDLSVVMTAPRPPDDRPVDGAPTIRPLRSADDWRQELLLRASLDGEDAPLPPGHREFLERSTHEARRMVEGSQAEYFGTFSDGRLGSVVGIASDGQGVARYQNVGTHPDFRRRGHASALLARAGSFAVEEFGAGLLVIVADRDGPASGLYRSLGFDPVEGQWGLSTSSPT
jgi:ribosomal protein S18 acetylase RimI-like enzyme